MKKKTALLTGSFGQDCSYIAELLLEKDYNIIGIDRSNAMKSLGNSQHLEGLIDIVEGDITDMAFMFKIIQSTRPNELYNMAAQSFVHASFEQPLSTLDIDTKGVVNILECVRLLGFSTRIIQASSSEMFGAASPPQNLDTIFAPQSPYAIAKVASHYFVKLYREAYKMHCSNAVTFNHEGERRGPHFVTRKISMGVAKCLSDPTFRLKLGNLNAKRDWGYAPDYVKGFWMALQQEEPGDYIFATNEAHSVLEFVEKAFGYVGLDWKEYVEIDRFHMRPAEVDYLLGDYSKTKEQIGWEPTVKFEQLVEIMVDNDCRLAGLIKNDETAKGIAKKCRE